MDGIISPSKGKEGDSQNVDHLTSAEIIEEIREIQENKKVCNSAYGNSRMALWEVNCRYTCPTATFIENWYPDHRSRRTLVKLPTCATSYYFNYVQITVPSKINQ